MALSDNQLIINAQRGDMASFQELIYRYDRHVLNIAKSFKNNEDDAKDIYQEVFIRVYKGLKNFQFKSEFSTWLFRITTNVCITFQTRKKNHLPLDKEISNNEYETTTFADLIHSDDKADKLAISGNLKYYINNALETLPAQQKMAFTLKFFNEYKIKEIADMMNCSEGTVKRYLFNATHRMRKTLRGLNEK